MAFFTEFTDPKAFMMPALGSTQTINSSLTECTVVGAKTDPATPIHVDPTSSLGQNSEDEKEQAGAIIVNQYDPVSKRFNEDGTPEQPHMSKEMGRLLDEHMDCYDPHTVSVLCAMNEAEQNSLLLSLTNKLYEMIVSKVDSIDYGEIPESKGDVTRLKNYKTLVETHKILKGIFEQYREKTEPVDVIHDALENLEDMKGLFMAAYAAKASFPISMYQTMTLAVVNATSFMIATCIEYIKSPKKEGLELVLNKTGIAKVKDHLVYESLKDFNEACRKGDVENALRPFVQNKARGFAVTAALGIKAALIIGGVVIAILPILKDLVYFYYASKARASEYFELQAKLIEINAQELKDNDDIRTEGDKASVIRKQLAIAQIFHQLSDRFAVDNKSAEVQATKEIKRDKQKYKIDEVEPSAAEGGPLF